MTIETPPPVQSIIMDLYEKLGVEIGRRYDICRALNGDAEARERHRGHGIHEHDGERIAEAILVLLKANSQ